jgi:threonine dehydratase
MLTLDAIREAHARIAPHVLRTPCRPSPRLGALIGSPVYLKLELLQRTGSFKERGACNKLLTLDPNERARGVIAASAGNHALGVSYHGRSLGIPATVVMPRFAPLVKIRDCKELGARVVLHGDTFGAALERARQLAADEGLSFVHGFDDPAIVAGQGTIGLEIAEDVPDAEVVLVPVGGGGLIAGVGTAVKATIPGVRVVGVEAERAPTLSHALAHGIESAIEIEPSLADGLAVSRLGELPYEIVKQVVDDVLVVDEPHIASAIVRLLELDKTVTEGAGAVGIAALLQHRSAQFRGKKIVVVLSGGNIDVSTISRVIERGLAAQGRLCRIEVELADHPGSLARFLALIAETGASLKHVEHDREFGPADVSRVTVSSVFETRDFDHIEEIRSRLQAARISLIALEAAAPVRVSRSPPK